MTKTVYFDEKQGRFVCIVKEGDFVTHHRLPKDLRDKGAALEASLPLGLRMEPSLRDHKRGY